MPKPILTLSFNGNAQANPYLTNPNSNLTESLGIFPNPFNLKAIVLANFGFLGPKLKYPAHLDCEPSAITRNLDLYVTLLLHFIIQVLLCCVIFSTCTGLNISPPYFIASSSNNLSNFSLLIIQKGDSPLRSATTLSDDSHLNSTFLILDSIDSSISNGRYFFIEDAIPPAQGFILPDASFSIIKTE